MTKQPDATLQYADAEAKLFRGAKRLNIAGKETACDQVIVEHFKGNDDNVVIYESDGRRLASRVRLIMNLVPESFSETVEPPSSEDEERLLTIYDQLVRASSPRNQSPYE